MELTLKAGLQTERIEDNRARALVNMKRYSDAVDIWQSLNASLNANIQKTANVMLERFETQGFQQKILNEVDNALTCNNDRQYAISLLTNAILKNPLDQKLHEKLGQIAMMSEDDNTDQQFEELSLHRQALAGFSAFITALEQKNKPTLQSADVTKESTPIMRIN